MPRRAGGAVQVQGAAAVFQRLVQVAGGEMGVKEGGHGVRGDDPEAAVGGSGGGMLGECNGSVDLAQSQPAGGEAGERHQLGVPGVGVAGEPQCPLVVGESGRVLAAAVADSAERVQRVGLDRAVAGGGGERDRLAGQLERAGVFAHVQPDAGEDT
jgi:hypothetical protein